MEMALAFLEFSMAMEVARFQNTARKSSPMYFVSKKDFWARAEQG